MQRGRAGGGRAARPRGRRQGRDEDDAEQRRRRRRHRRHRAPRSVAPQRGKPVTSFTRVSGTSSGTLLVQHVDYSIYTCVLLRVRVARLTTHTSHRLEREADGRTE